jgi:hypothetical protein
MATSRHSSLPTMLRSRVPLTDEQIMRVAPSVFADQPHESRGERYAYIPTSRVLQGLRNEGFVPMAVGQSRTRVPGKADFTKHMLRLRHRTAVDQIVGQEVPEIVLLNSHDGTSSYQLMGGIFRLICSNGMIVGDTTSEVRVRHSGNILENVIEGSYSVIEDINRVVPVIDDWKKLSLTYDQRKAYATAALGLRWDADDAGNVQAPVSNTSLLDTRRYEDRGDSLWKTFNVVQENLIRGGLRGEGSTGKRMTTRAVASVTENVRLNRALWSLTSEMARLATAA